MAFRFRRSVKIIPGVRLNFGKTGVSVSAGGRGATMTMGKSGLYSNFGLPGTGMSVRSKLAGGESSQSARALSSQPPSQQGKVSIQLNLDDSGNVTIKDEHGNPLPPKYQKLLREQQGELIHGWLEQQCENWNKGIDDMLNLHTETPPPTLHVAFEPAPFEEAQPQPPAPCSAGLSGLLFKSKREATERKNAEAMNEYQRRIQSWKDAKSEHEASEERRRWVIEKGRFQDRDAMGEFIEHRLSLIDWPRETIVVFDISEDGRTVMLDADLPEIEDMPTEVATVAARGYKINVKKRSEAQVRKEYVAHVHAVAFRVIGETFAALPKVEEVVFSGYSQRPVKQTGHIEDTYLISTSVARDAWEGIHFNNLRLIDHIACFDLFEVRRELAKSGTLNPIIPLGTSTPS